MRNRTLFKIQLFSLNSCGNITPSIEISPSTQYEKKETVSV